ncbi:MAG: hypothetical protein ACYCS8_05210 [Acidithiobacillus sp.]
MSEQDVLDAIRKYFYDTSRPQEETKEGLQGFVEEIEVLIDSLE